MGDRGTISQPLFPALLDRARTERSVQGGKGRNVASENFLGLSFEGWIAASTVVLTLATIALGLFTFFLWRSTRDAVRDGSKGIQISENTLAQATASAELQLRPYVFMHLREFGWLHHPTDKGKVGSRRVTIIWKNMGQTPARRVVACLSGQGFPSELPPDFDFPDVIAPGSVGSIGPGGTVNSYIDIPATEFGTAESPNHVYYWGWIEYDGFEGSPRHRTEVCAEFKTNDDPTHPETLFVDAFRTAFNGADADCLRISQS